VRIFTGLEDHRNSPPTTSRAADLTVDVLSQ
jgi:hypothetical protein